MNNRHRLLLNLSALVAMLDRKPKETVLVIGQSAVDAIGLPLKDLEREARAFGADRLIVAEPAPTITYADAVDRHNEPWRRKNRRRRR